eukprot:GHVS01008515.1.p1 GENE.GHVS01008515.1~~GHVS01008515.1.p1  ORF type:complete len:445 (-),score=94.16 GHVS01008515.1:1884-3218(-)
MTVNALSAATSRSSAGGGNSGTVGNAAAGSFQGSRAAQFYGAGNANMADGGEWGCFEENIQYVGWDIHGRGGDAPSARACQTRCQGDPGCDYFTFRPNTTECFLKASNFGRTAAASFVSGPKFCVNLSAQSPPSQQLWDYSNQQQSQRQQSPLTAMGMFGGMLGRSLVEVMESSSSGGEFLLADEFVILVIAGDQTTEQIQQKLIAHEQLASATNSNSSNAENASSSYSVDPTSSSAASLRALQRLGAVLRGPAQSIGGAASGLLGGGVAGGRIASTLMPRFNNAPSHCLGGFSYAQDMYRSRVRQQTVKTLQTAIVGSVNPDGTTTPGLTAETFTDGLVRNTNLLANRMAHWYTELATVPGEVVMASKDVTAVVDPARMMLGGGSSGMPNPLGITPTTAAMGAALGTGIMVAGIDKAIYGNGPGDSLVLDRTGISKKMAYGLV